MNVVGRDDDCEQAFKPLKNSSIAKPVLRMPDPKMDFVLRTDASGTGMGAVLLRPDGDVLHLLRTPARSSTVLRRTILW